MKRSYIAARVTNEERPRERAFRGWKGKGAGVGIPYTGTARPSGCRARNNAAIGLQSTRRKEGEERQNATLTPGSTRAARNRLRGIYLIRQNEEKKRERERKRERETEGTDCSGQPARRTCGIRLRFNEHANVRGSLSPRLFTVLLAGDDISREIVEQLRERVGYTVFAAFNPESTKAIGALRVSSRSLFRARNLVSENVQIMRRDYRRNTCIVAVFPQIDNVRAKR